MKVLVLLISTMWSLVSFSQGLDFKSQEWQIKEGKERRGYVSYLNESFDGKVLVVRVGSPLFNSLRNLVRNELDSGNVIPLAEAILNIEKIEGIGPNTLLVVKFKKPFTGSIYEAHNIRKELPPWKMYLYSQGKGFLEIFIENGKMYGVTMPVSAVIGIPYEVLNALSSESIWTRYENSGLAIWDSTKGIAYAVVDFPMELIEGDITRSLKALIRVPFSAVQLGATVATKTVRLPFDLAMSTVVGIRKTFLNNTTLSTRDRARLVRKNSDYDVTLSFANKIIEGEAELRRPSRGVSYLKIQGNTIALRWTVFDNQDPFLADSGAGLFGATFTFQGKNFLLLGKIDGVVDVEIGGDIIELQESVVLESDAIFQYFVKYNGNISAVGKFYFND